MTAFKGLLLKDYHISKSWLVYTLIAEMAMLIVTYGIGLYFDNALLFLPQILLMMIAFHIFFAPVNLLQMLYLEGKTQLWLHNPQSSKKLLFSKVIVNTSYQLISQLVLTLAGILVYSMQVDTFYFETSFFIKLVIIVNSILLFGGFVLSCAVLFYWTLYHSLGKFTQIKNFRWLILIFIHLTYMSVVAALGNLRVIEWIASKWTTPISIDFQYFYNGGMLETNFQAVPFPVMLLVYYILLSIVLFFIASWLLDRKVEV